MSDTKDYNLSYQHVSDKLTKKNQLRVVLQTSEFGPMPSKLVDATEDKEINDGLLNSLADDMIDAYEKKLVEKRVFNGWSKE